MQLQPIIQRFAVMTCTLLIAAGSARAADGYVQTNLVSDIPGMAPNTDPNLQGAWGLSYSATSPFWVSDQNANFLGSGAASVYKVSDTPIPTSSGPLLTVAVTNEGNAPPSGPAMTNGPTGQVSPGAGDHHGLGGLLGRHVPGQLHFRQSRRLDLRLEHACGFALGDRDDRCRCLDTAGVNLNAPWGLAIAPTGWGQFGGDLLVGNNNENSAGLTEINAYNLTTGAFEGTLMLSTGQPFSATELWAISFGNGAGAGSADTLFFTAGLDNNTDGLFGAISVPEPSSSVLGLIAVGMVAGGWQWKKRRRTQKS